MTHECPAPRESPATPRPTGPTRGRVRVDAARLRLGPGERHLARIDLGLDLLGPLPEAHPDQPLGLARLLPKVMEPLLSSSMSRLPT